jgi:hypothetical protein
MWSLPIRVARAFRLRPEQGRRPRHARGTPPHPEVSNPAGYVFEDPVAYVWDEDLQAARGWAGELRAARPPARRGARGVEGG